MSQDLQTSLVSLHAKLTTFEDRINQKFDDLTADNSIRDWGIAREFQTVYERIHVEFTKVHTKFEEVDRSFGELNARIANSPINYLNQNIYPRPALDTFGHPRPIPHEFPKRAITLYNLQKQKYCK
jgi:hypothetical protein